MRKRRTKNKAKRRPTARANRLATIEDFRRTMREPDSRNVRSFADLMRLFETYPTGDSELDDEIEKVANEFDRPRQERGRIRRAQITQELRGLLSRLGVAERAVTPRASATLELINNFITKVETDTGTRPKRKDIWTVAGYADSTEFGRFQRGSSRTTIAAGLAFSRVLKMEPKEFIEQLEKKRKTKVN